MSAMFMTGKMITDKCIFVLQVLYGAKMSFFKFAGKLENVIYLYLSWCQARVKVRKGNGIFTARVITTVQTNSHSNTLYSMIKNSANG